MTWGRLDDGLHDHPKVDRMLEADELRGGAALGLWTAALSYSADQLTDGVVSRRAVQRLFPSLGIELASVLVEYGLWDVADGGWKIRGYLDCNPPREDILERRRADAERKAAARAQRASERTSDQTSQRTSARNPNGRPDPPAQPNPTQPNPKGGRPAVYGRAPARAAAPARTTPLSQSPETELAEHIRGILQRGIDGLTNDEPAKTPTVEAIQRALAKHDTTRDVAIAVAVDVRAIAQSQNRAPNIAALYEQKLAAANGKGKGA